MLLRSYQQVKEITGTSYKYLPEQYHPHITVGQHLCMYRDRFSRSLDILVGDLERLLKQRTIDNTSYSQSEQVISIMDLWMMTSSMMSLFLPLTFGKIRRTFSGSNRRVVSLCLGGNGEAQMIFGLMFGNKRPLQRILFVGHQKIDG